LVRDRQDKRGEVRPGLRGPAWTKLQLYLTLWPRTLEETRALEKPIIKHARKALRKAWKKSAKLGQNLDGYVNDVRVASKLRCKSGAMPASMRREPQPIPSVDTRQKQSMSGTKHPRLGKTWNARLDFGPDAIDGRNTVVLAGQTSAGIPCLVCRRWCSLGAAGASKTRVDEYLRDPDQDSLGIKKSGGGDVEIKGLSAVEFAGCTSPIDSGPSGHRTRWMACRP
jgi:hypothetical protein